MGINTPIGASVPLVSKIEEVFNFQIVVTYLHYRHKLNKLEPNGTVAKMPGGVSVKQPIGTTIP